MIIQFFLKNSNDWDICFRICHFYTLWGDAVSFVFCLILRKRLFYLLINLLGIIIVFYVEPCVYFWKDCKITGRFLIFSEKSQNLPDDHLTWLSHFIIRKEKFACTYDFKCRISYFEKKKDTYLRTNFSKVRTILK